MEAHLPEFAPDVITYIGQWPITNTIFNAWLAIAILLVIGIVIRQTIKMRPSKFQNFAEFALEGMLGYFDQVTGDRKRTVQFLPVVGTIFFFILLSNWLGLIPGTGSITAGDTTLLRPANTDLNLTVAMALVSVIASHIYGLIALGIFTHANKFIQIGTIFRSLKRGPLAIFTALIEFVVGLIEIMGEMTKVISLSFRLFGNIFAGEVLISVISGMVAVFAPAPFMILEVLVGLIQAGVFAMLTLSYLTLATNQPHGAEAEH